jgi:hypothetical protein
MQRELRVYHISMDTALSLEDVMHFYSYIRPVTQFCLGEPVVFQLASWTNILFVLDSFWKLFILPTRAWVGWINRRSGRWISGLHLIGSWSISRAQNTPRTPKPLPTKIRDLAAFDTTKTNRQQHTCRQHHRDCLNFFGSRDLVVTCLGTKRRSGKHASLTLVDRPISLQSIHNSWLPSYKIAFLFPSFPIYFVTYPRPNPILRGIQLPYTLSYLIIPYHIDNVSFNLQTSSTRSCQKAQSTFEFTTYLWDPTSRGKISYCPKSGH